MNTVVRLDDHRPVDPIEHPEFKQLLADWYSHSIGGTPEYGPVLLTAYLGSSETDPLHKLRFDMPKIMLAAQPVAAAWAKDQICDLDYVAAAVPDTPKLVVREWLTALVEVSAIRALENNAGRIVYVPSRGMIYRVCEIIIQFKIAWRKMATHSPSALDHIMSDRDWVSIETDVSHIY